MPRVVDFDPFADTPKTGRTVDFDPFAGEEKPQGGGVSDYVNRAYNMSNKIDAGLGRVVTQAIPNAVLGLPALAADAYDSLSNLAIRGFNTMAPSMGQRPMAYIPPFRSSQAVQQLGEKAADVAGFPRPQTKLGQGLTNIGTAMLSAGTGASGARALLNAAPSVAAVPSMAMPLQALAQAPTAQAIGAGTSSLAVDLAKGAGITDPRMLMAIGAVGGMGPGSTTKATTGTVKAIANPLTRSGKEVAVGNVLNELATNPAVAQRNLETATQIVPGSAPTVAQVGRDAGLAAAETALRGSDKQNLIGNRISQQNAARQAELGRVAGDEGIFEAAKAKRDAAYTDFAEPAFTNKTPVEIGRQWIDNPILRKITTIRESKEGARKTVQDAMDEAEALLTQERVDITDVENLYQIRKDLALARDGKLSGKGKSGAELANMSTARSQINDVIKSLDEVIEKGAPGYAKYLNLYAKRSIPLDQLEALQKIRSRAILSAPDPVTGEAILSQSKFTQLLRNNLDAGLNIRGGQSGFWKTGQARSDSANLSSNQIATLDRVAADLDRGAAATSATAKVPGSDTFRNLSIANVIGRVIGDRQAKVLSESPVGGAVTSAFGYLYHIPDQQIQQLLLEAWLDPKLAAKLMQKATEANVESVADELGKRFAAQSAATAIYGQ